MAEVVEEMQERMLPEYEQLKQYQVLNDEQIRECIRQRSSLAVKVTQSKKTVLAYFEFISYECKMHNLITEKEKSLGVALSAVKLSMSARIIKLFRECLQKFPHDERIWSVFLKFSKKSVPHEVLGIYEKMLSYHGDKPKYWCDAANWAYEYGKNIGRVRDILLRGLQRNEDSELLHECFFTLLLNDAARMNPKKNLNNDTISEQDIGMERVDAIYANSKKHVKNIEFYQKLLERCEQTEFSDLTIKLQMHILEDMKQMFPRDEQFWDLLAQRELRGLSMYDVVNLGQEVAEVKKIDQAGEEADDDSQAVPPVASKSTVWHPRTLEQRIELCVEVYRKAVGVLKTTRMCTLFINAMLLLNENMFSQPKLKRKSLATAFKTGHELRCMSNKHYETFRNLLVGSPDGAQRAAHMLNEAIEAQPQNFELYELLIEIYLLDNDVKKVEELFDTVRNLFDLKSYPIWQRVIAFYTLDTREAAQQRLMKLYREGSALAGNDFVALRCDYLAHCAKVGGIKSARQVYKQLMHVPPLSLSVHRKMAELEKHLKQHTPEDIKQWRQCLEYMTLFFGTVEPTIWLEYIEFEREHGNCKLVPKIYERAKAALKPEYVEGFVSMFALSRCEA